MFTHQFIALCVFSLTAGIGTTTISSVIQPTQPHAPVQANARLEVRAVNAPETTSTYLYSTQTYNNPQSGIPPIRTQYHYYPIYGSSVADLRSQMHQFSSVSYSNHEGYDAYTEWHVRWAYQLERTGNGCAIASATSSVDVTFTLPQWNAPADASPSLVADWHRYMNALQEHENGHRDHGIAAGVAILRVLEDLPPAAACSELTANANAAIDRAIAHYHQQDLEYDEITQHGQTQGAIFPFNLLSER